MLHIKFGFDWSSSFTGEDVRILIMVIYIYNTPGWGQMRPLGPILFSESLIFSPTAHFLQDFHFALNDFLKVFSIQMHWGPMLTLP